MEGRGKYGLFMLLSVGNLLAFAAWHTVLSGVLAILMFVMAMVNRPTPGKQGPAQRPWTGEEAPRGVWDNRWKGMDPWQQDPERCEFEWPNDDRLFRCPRVAGHEGPHGWSVPREEQQRYSSIPRYPS